VVFLWELSVGHRALSLFMVEFGVVPHQCAGGAERAIRMIRRRLRFVPMFTSMFLHASFLHVAGNMLFLWISATTLRTILALPVSRVLSHQRVAASATHILLNQASRVPSVGASGAIAGVMGAYFVLYPRARVLIWFPRYFSFMFRPG